jgi:hypothetical protein
MSEPFNQTQAKTRLLLALWDMGEPGSEIKKGDLTRRVVRTGEKAADYQPILGDLAQKGAIAIAKVKGATLISLSDRGRQVLAAGLKNTEFAYGGNQVGSRVANALLKWIRQVGDFAPELDSKTSAVVIKAIASYDQFKRVALATYDRLNSDYNYDHLVPIYRIRREIGDRVTRAQFNDWMLEMQANDVFQLQGGALEDGATDKLQDSIMDEITGMRCYAKLLNQSHK